MTKIKIIINNFRSHYKKTYDLILIILLISVCKLHAQQVTKVDCCVNISVKAIIITNNATNSITTNSIENNIINSRCNFKLSSTANTSAGIFNSSGVLIRTLWSGTYYDVGCYNLQWDGLLDDGTSAPSGTYIAKVLTHNVNYILEGGIGNTSSNLNDATTHKGFAPIASGGMAFSQSKGYYGEQFVEGGSSTKKFLLNNIQSKSDVNTGLSALVTRICTDGTNIYWAVNDQYNPNGQQTVFVYTTKVSDDSETIMPNGVTVNNRGYNYTNAIDFRREGNNQIVAIAVQKTGSFLFTKRASADSITFTNKVTGAFVSKISFPGVLNLAAENSNLWVGKAGGIERFTVNGNGTLTTTGTAISISSPGQMAISPDNSTLAVLDMATHQVKGFSTANGSLLWTLGSLNGFVGSPAVTNYKFYFNDVSACVAYQPDGSLWVNDYGSYRLMHYDASRNYLEQIQYIPASRSTNIDLNDPARYFADELEFKRDYSKPLDNGVNGSWVFANNWKPNTQLDVYQKFKQVATLSNGHTYAIGSNGENVYDLTVNGAVFVGNVPGYGGEVMEADGSITYRNILDNGATVQMVGKQLTGYADNFMPQWGGATTFATTSTNGPISYNNNTKGGLSNSSKYFFFQPGSYPGYHLGGTTKTGANDKWLWQASKSTFSKYYDSNNQHVEGTARDYTGDYPRNGDFDIGNNNGPGPQHSENCQLWVNGSNLIWNVNAEFWKDGYEANIMNHFNEDGLFIGNFGKTYIDAGVTGNAGYAGNAYSTALTTVNGVLYFTECDESQHSSIMCWAITGLNTIQEQSIPITLTAAPALAIDSTNLISGLPYNNFFYGGNGWLMMPSVGNNQDGQYPQWAVHTSQNTYQKNDMDLWFESDNSNLGDRYITRSLGNNNNMVNWAFTGYILTQNGNVNYEVLDGRGKILAQLTLNPAGNKVNGIDVGHYTDQNVNKNFIGLFQKFTLKNTGGTITFQYASYPPITIPSPLETNGSFNTPATFRIRPYGSGGSKGIGSVKGLRFNIGTN